MCLTFLKLLRCASFFFFFSEFSSTSSTFRGGVIPVLLDGSKPGLLLLVTLKVSASMMWSYFPRDGLLWPLKLYTYTCVQRGTRVHTDTCTARWSIPSQIVHITSVSHQTSHALISRSPRTVTSLSIYLFFDEIERGDWKKWKGKEWFQMQQNEPCSGETGTLTFLRAMIASHSAMSVPRKRDWQDELQTWLVVGDSSFGCWLRVSAVDYSLSPPSCPSLTLSEEARKGDKGF